MDYIPHTPHDQEQLLEKIGVHTLEDLFADIAEKLRVPGLLALPEALSEQELSVLMNRMSSRNSIPRLTLTGAGAYCHYIPSVVRSIIGRSEFYTAYTPYQAEISQGILQAIFEYQTMIAKLTGMKVANASLYDGASAMAEAAIMAARTLERRKIVMIRSVHPEYRRVVRTYAWANGCEAIEVPCGGGGQLDLEFLERTIDADTACVLVQSPNFFGVIEDVAAVAPPVHSQGALLVAGFTEATSLGILKPAGETGADIVVGEGQGFGNPLNFGGPYLGIFAATEQFTRKVPGRLVGETVDRNGRRGFVLTLQTREQHIRREKATSNICTNDALCALAAAVYLVCLGKNLRHLAELNVQNARYLRNELCRCRGWHAVFSDPAYNEFVIACPSPREANRKWLAHGIVGGYELERNYPELKNCLLLCATEMHRKEDIDYAVSLVS